MSGAINTVGKFFNSDIGRVVAGVATAGTSEIGRAAAGVARRSGVDPGVSAGIGYLAGNTPAPTTATIAAPSSAGVVTPGVPGTTASLTSASGSVATTNQDMQSAVDAEAQASDARLNAERETEQRRLDALSPAEQERARARAQSSAARAGSGGRRRASQSLTSLGA